MLRIDDPQSFFADMPDDIQQQIRAQMPEMDDPAASDSGGGFGGFGDFMQSAFDNIHLNSNQNFAGNAWNVGKGLAQTFEVDLGPIGVLNPNSDFEQNVKNVSHWATNEFMERFGDELNLPSMGDMLNDIFRKAGSEPAAGADTTALDVEGSDTTTFYTPNGDPIEIDNSFLNAQAAETFGSTATDVGGATEAATEAATLGEAGGEVVSIAEALTAVEEVAAVALLL